MDIFNVFSLLGGLAMFLYGMRLMGDSLKENSSGALKRAMEMVTNNPVKAFFLGLLVTAVIQSSTATIVITADERVCSGAHYARFFADMRKYLDHPELLEEPPAAVRFDEGMAYHEPKPKKA